MENRLIFLLAMPNLFLMLERCFSIVVGEVFKRLATSLLVRPFFIILQISISLEVNLALLSASRRIKNRTNVKKIYELRVTYD